MNVNLLINIRNNYESLTRSEKKIADFILNKGNEILSLSISQLAIKCGTSEASVSRFCRTLNLNNYQTLKISLSHELADEKISERKRMLYEKISDRDSVKEIVEKIFMGNVEAIEATSKILNTDRVGKAINVLDKANSIAVFGVGASAIVGLDIQYKFSRIGIPTFMYLDSHMQITTASLMKKGDVALAISNSGKTKDVLDALSIAKKNGATTISITQVGDSPINKLSDIVLNTVYVENNFRSGATSSRIAQLTILDSVFMGVACRRYDDVVKKLEITRNALDKR